MNRIRSTSFCFTLNNYTDEEVSALTAFCEEHCKYYVFGREVGEGGTHHLQGYFRLRRRVDIRQLSGQCCSRAHYEVARGSPRQNRDYCIKDGEFTEGGELPKGGAERSNRDSIAREFATAVRSGHAGVDSFAEQYPGSWYYSGYSLLRNAQLIIPAVHRPEITVQWYHGEPGVGKSRRAHEELPEAYIKEPRTKWWNGYMYEKEVIIDDFAPGGLDVNHLLRWFDRYKCYVETKGGMVALHAYIFIVTSNFHPIDCFKDKDGVPHPQHEALMRRVSVIHME